ncbi:MAG: hypothetical protein K8Q88_06950 [Nitrosarchaeum sp.]|nr:hypothetical protein [Nitrosarchaeum sp.]
MSYSIFGQVVGVRKYANGDIDLDFYHDDELTEYKYSPNSTLLDNFPKELAETLASTLASDICVEIYFNESGSPTHIELEECDYDDEEN